jgi:hypothetical protein
VGCAGEPRPAWTSALPIQWAGAGKVSKLLGSPFGLTLSSSDVDQFLIDRTDRKLHY